MKSKQTLLRQGIGFLMTALVFPPASLFAASHREAPITALDQKADITEAGLGARD